MTSNQRGRASLKVLLVFLLMIPAGLLALPGGLLGIGVAQTGPKIQWLNPSDYADTLYVSKKEDQSSSTKANSYHLVAWTSSLPSNPVVEFRYQRTNAATPQLEVTIAQAQRVGTTDTFELDWTMKDALGNDLASGDYALRAILFSNGIEVARDESNVSTSSNELEAVEITQPDNGEPLGFYRAPVGGSTDSAILDISRSASNPQPTTSPGVTFLRRVYTLSAPGTEPAWKDCGISAPGPGPPSPFTCVLASGDNPMAVTAVGAVGNFEPRPTGQEPYDRFFDEGGDAHRVFPYLQLPTTIGIEWAGAPPPTNSYFSASGACSPNATSTVRDQLRSDSEFPLGRQIQGVHIDVHGKGPTDQFQFDAGTRGSSDRSTANKAPDKGHLSTEPARDCEGSAGANVGTEGQHEFLSEPDLKHIETTASTNINGRMVFVISLPGGESGITQLTVWADEDDDDQFCSAEAHGHAALAWGPAGTPAPGVTGLQPEKEVCPRPTPGVTPTSTGSQTPTATASTTSPSQTGTATVTLEASKNIVKFNQSFQLSGQLTKNNPQTSDTCIAARTVILQRTVAGETSAEQVDTQVSNAAGQFSFSRTGDKSANYVARVETSGNCTAAASSPEEVKVKKKVKMKISSSRVDPGDKVTFRIGVKPCAGHEGERVVLFKFKNGRAVKVDSKKISNRCKAKFVVEMEKTAKWQARSPKQDVDHEAGKTKKRKVVVR